MAVKDIIREVGNSDFYTRVAFIALKVAEAVAIESGATPNHANRLAYAYKVMSGEDKALLIAMHVAASNPTIAATLTATGHATVTDGDIEYALGQLWDARSNAFA